MFSPHFAILQYDKEKNSISLIPIKTPQQSLKDQYDYIVAETTLENIRNEEEKKNASGQKS